MVFGANSFNRTGLGIVNASVTVPSPLPLPKPVTMLAFSDTAGYAIGVFTRVSSLM